MSFQAADAKHLLADSQKQLNALADIERLLSLEEPTGKMGQVMRNILLEVFPEIRAGPRPTPIRSRADDEPVPWMPTDTMSLRSEFVQLAQQPGQCFRALCQCFGISPKTGYKWCAHYQADQPLSLSDQSRRPLHSPTRTALAMQQLLLELRQQRSTRGGRKLATALAGSGSRRGAGA